MSRRALVLGCGGTLGMSWTLATLKAIEEHDGWDARDADVIIGTSAGAELACLLGSGTSVTELLAAQTGDPRAPAWVAAHLDDDPGRLPPLPRPRITAPHLAARALRGKASPLTALTGLLPAGSASPVRLHALAERCTDDRGWVSHPATRIVACDLTTGARVAFGSPGAPPATLAQALHASWAVPGWVRPAELAGRRYVDGGVVSPASADLAAGEGAEEVLVLAPMASADPGRPVGLLARAERLMRTAMTRRLDDEVAALRDSGIRVRRFDPGGRDLAAMGGNVMDARRRRATLVAARASARDRLTARTALD